MSVLNSFKKVSGLNCAVMVLTIVFAVYVALHWKDKVFKQRISRARYDCLGNGFVKFPIYFFLTDQVAPFSSRLIHYTF